MSPRPFHSALAVGPLLSINEASLPKTRQDSSQHLTFLILSLTILFPLMLFTCTDILNGSEAYCMHSDLADLCIVVPYARNVLLPSIYLAYSFSMAPSPYGWTWAQTNIISGIFDLPYLAIFLYSLPNMYPFLCKHCFFITACLYLLECKLHHQNAFLNNHLGCYSGS